ncbi:MAG: nucleotidyltransferase domain-containing protein [Candidatus Marinimicrobia bacterium]|nr:nucleotidyltransferase domain-containing protein [Candidatus Neomarinimicrobiota bacterium]
MVNIEKLKPEIVERLKPLKPDKIILFGSYANGTATEDSDIDLFLLKDDLQAEEMNNFEIDAKMRLLDLISTYKIGFDILSFPTNKIYEREDYFYKVDVLQNGKVWYE